MKFIGNKISVQESKEKLSVVISGVGERWEKAVLSIWTFLWLGIGVYFILELLASDDRNFKLFLIVFLSFWVFYMSKAIQILFWRLFGYNSLIVLEDKLIVRNFNWLRSIEKSYFVQNIERVEVLELKDKSLNRAYYSGFWVKGLNMISFTHKGKKVNTAPQISSLEAQNIAHKLDKRIVKIKRDSK